VSLLCSFQKVLGCHMFRFQTPRCERRTFFLVSCIVWTRSALDASCKMTAPDVDICANRTTLGRCSQPFLETWKRVRMSTRTIVAHLGPLCGSHQIRWIRCYGEDNLTRLIFHSSFTSHSKRDNWWSVTKPMWIVSKKRMDYNNRLAYPKPARFRPARNWT
jgi:hypothetical protein